MCAAFELGAELRDPPQARARRLPGREPGLRRAEGRDATEPHREERRPHPACVALMRPGRTLRELLTFTAVLSTHRTSHTTHNSYLSYARICINVHSHTTLYAPYIPPYHRNLSVNKSPFFFFGLRIRLMRTAHARDEAGGRDRREGGAAATEAVPLLEEQELAHHSLGRYATCAHL